ncbi:MAG TPA: ABC transporter ATP-binding protein [Longimicrobiales bacterium]|nr:ABC transporter ATP-binding protein [Longimicrobiales bacterium]
MTGATVQVEALTRRFGDITAVDALSMDIPAGELFGLVGPDGAGKTTTLRMLAGVLHPTSGDAVVAGHSVAREPGRVRPHIAYMSQRFGLYEDLTVRENLDFYADLYRVPRADRPARLERLFAFSNLEPFQDRLAGQLSGGMKQKLSLSCALIHHPSLLLLDEPTFGVDPISRRELWTILLEMVAEGVTVILSTAYMDEAERCHRVALLDGGRVLALDTPQHLKGSLDGELVTVLAPEPRRARDVLRAAPGLRRAALFGERLHVVVPREAGRDPAAAVRDTLGAAGIDAEVRSAEPSLEDIFIARVEGPDRG